jgi:chemotaxis protein methyltransferase CheR
MPSPAYLCVAAAESLLRRTTVFELQDIGGAFIYVKGAVPQLAATFPAAQRAS